jgi:predicted flap endonuclease-1-like 5' DNA nuclease
MSGIVKIEGIGEVYANKLAQVGVKTVMALLEKGSTPKGRKDLAEKSGLSETQILKWVNQADLFRIKGIGEDYSDLLEAAGVDTVMELAQRNSENLLEKLTSVNAEKKLVCRLPTLKMVSTWVEMAKCLPRKVNY